MTQIFIFVGSIFWTIVSAVTVYLFTQCAGHEKRIQRIEDVQGHKIDQLSEDFKQFKIEVDNKLEAILGMIHKEKNVEGQINQTLNLLLKHLESHDKEVT